MNSLFKLSDLGITSSAVPTEDARSRDANPFEEIGIGKPLTIRLHTVYVGNLKNGLLNNRQAVLVTSMIKDDITYEIPPKGVHQVFRTVRDRTTLFPAASNEGTELIYYSPAFDSGVLKFDIEIKADRFNKQMVDDVCNGLTNAAGLPVFAPYASYMMAGTQFIKVAGNIIEKIIERDPILSFPFDIRENLGGLRDSEAGFLLGTSREHHNEFEGYQIIEDPGRHGGIILAKDGVEYQGDAPYLILSVDGRKNNRYKDFKATKASAQLLKQFYGGSGTTMAEDLQSAMSLYNDFKYLQKAREASRALEHTTDNARREELMKELEAYKLNIGNEDLLKALGE